MIYVGTSGWVYDDWKGRFYPKGMRDEERFPFYAARYPTVEINYSFYRLPSEDAFKHWRAQAPPGFLFAVKASRYITHIKRLRDPKDSVDLFWARARLLGDRLGPVLFQLPPRFPADPPRLQTLLETLPKKMKPALEFRDLSWERDDVFDILDRHKAAFVYADRPRARVPDVVTGGWSYIRFHQGSTVGPGYPRAKLARWADRIATIKAQDVYIYFNNDTGGAAVRDAATLTDMLAERGLQVAIPSR
ncbi:MAG: DUF72 domain-containing protein [Actinomycetota bacterium]